MSAQNNWTLREILIVAALGAAFGVLYLAWVQVWLIAQAIFGPVTMDVVMGFWFIVSIIAAAIIRKPGAALLSEVLAAMVEVLLGSPAGLMLIVAGTVQGAGAELVFAATRWKDYRSPRAYGGRCRFGGVLLRLHLDSFRLWSAGAGPAHCHVHPAVPERRFARRLGRQSGDPRALSHRSSVGPSHRPGPTRSESVM